MPPLIRQIRFQIALRRFSVSAVTSARGSVQKRTRVPDLTQDVPDVLPLDRSSFAAQRKHFDLSKYTDAVRGDLHPNDERQYFLDQKAPWMASRNSKGNRVEAAYRPKKNDFGGKYEEFDTRRHDVEELESLDQREPEGPSKYEQFAQKQYERNFPRKRPEAAAPPAHIPNPRLVTKFRPREDKDEKIDYYKPKPKHYELSGRETKVQFSEAVSRHGRNFNPAYDERGEDEFTQNMDEVTKPSQRPENRKPVQRSNSQEQGVLSAPETYSRASAAINNRSERKIRKQDPREEFHLADPTASAARSSKTKPTNREIQRRNDSFTSFRLDETIDSQPRPRKEDAAAPRRPQSNLSREEVVPDERSKARKSLKASDNQYKENDDDVSARYSQQKRTAVSSGAQKSTVAGKISRGFTFLADGDKTFQATLTDVKNRKFRLKNRKILLEGIRLINEALENGARVRIVFFSNPELMQQLSNDGLDLMQPELYQVSPKQMELWSDMSTPPGIIAIADMPVSFDQTNAMPLTVILDNIRDPGNMGAIIRVLAGAGCKQVIAMNGCVDPWDPKVVRAGMGGHFHLPVQWNIHWDLVINHLENPAVMYIADNLEEKGVDPLALREDTKRPRLWRKRNHVQLDSVPYHKVDFRSESVILIIGGETHGVSEEAYAMTKERGGKKLVISMSNDMESLNAASAVAVLAFEMKRQRLSGQDGVEIEDGDVDDDSDDDEDSSSDESESDELLGREESKNSAEFPR